MSIMGQCSRCCLRDSMRLVNLIMLLFGIVMIIYSLWLQKKWNVTISDFPLSSSFPKPSFIFACLGVGIIVSLSTVGGHIVANSISNSTLCIYIVVITCILLLEIAVTVALLFMMDWTEEFAPFIGKDQEAFLSFLLFHVEMCRIITLVVLAAQVTVVILGIILRAVGADPRTHCFEPNVPNFTQSFLVPNSPDFDVFSNACTRCNSFRDLPRRRTFLSFIKGKLADRFQRRTNLH